MKICMSWLPRAMSCALLLGLFCNCATIANKSKSPKMYLSSTPNGAMVTVRDANGNILAKNIAPYTINTPSRQNSMYITVSATKEGYAGESRTQFASVNPWFYGNLVLMIPFIFPAAVGMYVDYFSGEYKIYPEQVHVVLETKETPIASSVNPAAPLLNPSGTASAPN